MHFLFFKKHQLKEGQKKKKKKFIVSDTFFKKIIIIRQKLSLYHKKNKIKNPSIPHVLFRKQY
jgi:hypothetical protein